MHVKNVCFMGQYLYLTPYIKNIKAYTEHYNTTTYIIIDTATKHLPWLHCLMLRHWDKSCNEQHGLSPLHSALGLHWNFTIQI